MKELEIIVQGIEKVIPLTANNQFLILTKNCDLQLWYGNELLFGKSILPQMEDYRKQVSHGYEVKEEQNEFCSYSLRAHCESQDSSKILLNYNISILTPEVEYGWDVCSIFVEVILKDLSISRIVVAKPISNSLNFDPIHNCYIAKYSVHGATARFSSESLKLIEEIPLLLYSSKAYVDTRKSQLIGQGFDRLINIWSLHNFVKLKSIQNTEKVYDFVYDSENKQLIISQYRSKEVVIFNLLDYSSTKLQITTPISEYDSLKLFHLPQLNYLIIPFRHRIDVYNLFSKSLILSFDHPVLNFKDSSIDGYIRSWNIAISANQNLLFTITSDEKVRKYLLK
jgi:hypothetical protein